MSNDKPREFYIQSYYRDGGDATHDIQQVFSEDDHTIGKLTDYTHTIEYSAYETLEAKVKELEEKIKVAVEGLEYYKHDSSGWRCETNSVGAPVWTTDPDVADATIEKLRGEK